jgi:hypothetical protein
MSRHGNDQYISAEAWPRYTVKQQNGVGIQRARSRFILVCYRYIIDVEKS